MREVIQRVCAEHGSEWWGVALNVSMIDCVEAAAAALPGATIDCCTYSLAWRVAQRLAALDVRRVMVCGAVQKMPGAYDRARVDAAIGDRLRMSWTHAKFAVFTTPARRVSLVTSANLSKNQRWESYLVTDDPAVGAALIDHLDDLDRLGAEPYREVPYYLGIRKRALRGAAADVSLQELARRLAR